MPTVAAVMLRSRLEIAADLECARSDEAQTMEDLAKHARRAELLLRLIGKLDLEGVEYAAGWFGVQSLRGQADRPFFEMTAILVRQAVA